MTEFPSSLKSWRQARRYSQLDLALEAEVSARHISFLETGRARPSREMIGRLGEALRLPLDARNQLLNQAGFAARYPGRQWDSDEMAPIREAVEYMLRNHAPYPAIALDRLWTIIRMNHPAQLLFGQFGIGEGGSLLDLMISDTPASVIENWPVVAHHTAARLRIESMAQGGLTRLDEVAEKLSRVAGPVEMSPVPVVPVILNTGSLRLSMFSTIAQFGTPEDVTLEDFKIELYFPADPQSADVLRGFGAQATSV